MRSFLFFVLLMALPSTCWATIFVNAANDKGPWDGKSWATAFRTVNEAITVSAADEEIWVAKGTYYPSADGDRSGSIVLKQGSQLFGGFSGTEENRGQRDPRANPTILSGDLGKQGEPDDNSCQIIKGASDSVLDEFVICLGNANGEKDDAKGAGLFNVQVENMVITNCIFEGNIAVEGAAIYNCAKSKVIVSRSIFRNNRAEHGGAVVNRDASSGRFEDCSFTGNKASLSGGAVFNDFGSSPVYIDCWFTGNSADGYGGAAYNDASGYPDGPTRPIFVNCRFELNSAGQHGGAISNYSKCSASITDCVFEKNSAVKGGGAISNFSGVEVNIITCKFSENIAQTGEFDIETDQGSTLKAAGLTKNLKGVYDGYTLFAPNCSRYTFLINNLGEVVHQWISPYRPGLAVYLLENGHLLRTCANAPNRIFPFGGKGGILQEYDWDGNLVWEFAYSGDRFIQHHDIEPMTNGNFLLIAWDFNALPAARDAGRKVLNGRVTPLFTDSIIEVQPIRPQGGKIVWEWHSWDHMIQDVDDTKGNFGNVAQHPELLDINYFKRPTPDWSHVNSVSYNSELDQIALSVHSFDELWIIDHSTTTAEAASHIGGRQNKGGDILYRWGNPNAYRAGTIEDKKLFAQHDVRWVKAEEGWNLTLYNNGPNRPEGRYSSIDEIKLPVSKDGSYTRVDGKPFGPEGLFWTYTAPIKASFFSINISGAHRLPNGNTIICAGVHARFFEVTPEGSVVWEFISPFTGFDNFSAPSATTIEGGTYEAGYSINPNTGISPVFRVLKYSADYPAFKGRNLAPIPIDLLPHRIGHEYAKTLLPENFLKLPSRPDMMSFDRDGDGRLVKEEAPVLIRRAYDKVDTNNDGYIDKEEAAAYYALAEKQDKEKPDKVDAPPPADRPKQPNGNNPRLDYVAIAKQGGFFYIANCMHCGFR